MIPFFSKVHNFKPMFNDGKMVITVMLYALKLGISSSFVFHIKQIEANNLLFPQKSLETYDGFQMISGVNRSYLIRLN